MPFPSLSIFRLLLAVCLSALACAAQASIFVFNPAGDEVLDTSTGWVWKRCSLGQSWNGQTCVGNAQTFTFDGAIAAARSHAGWVVPSFMQLISLRVCSAGESKGRLSVQDRWSFSPSCSKGSNKPAINASVFPAALDYPFWSSSDVVDDYALGVSFADGSVYTSTRSTGSALSKVFAVRLVRDSQLLDAEGALAFGLGANFTPAVRAQSATLEQSLGAVTLPWEPKSTVNQSDLATNAPTVDLQRIAPYLKVLVLADIHQAPAPVVGVIDTPKLTEPVREAFQPRQVSIPAKGEFETTAAFEARKQRADQEAKDSAEQAYQSALRAFNAEQLALKQQQAKQEADNAAARAQAEVRKTDPQAYRSAFFKAWEVVTAAHLGDPVLQNIAYDADRQVFTAQLRSSYGGLVGDVTAPVPLAQAPAFKADLLSGKIAPKVTFAYPSMRLDWALIENSAQRRVRFLEAQNSIDDLDALIREFPNAPEVSAAKRRVQALIAEEFSSANNSTELQSVLNKYPTAAEAPAARKRVEQLRLAEIAQEFSNANNSTRLQSVLDKYPNAAEAPAARKRVEQLRLAEQRAEREAQEAARRAEREAQEASRRACNRFYVGMKVRIIIQREAFLFGTQHDSVWGVVLGLNPQNGVLSFKVTEGDRYYEYGDVVESRCDDVK